LIIGHFSKVKDNEIPFGVSLEDMIVEKVKDLDFPVVFGFPAGHEHENWSLIFGAKVRLEINLMATLKTI